MPIEIQKKGIKTIVTIGVIFILLWLFSIVLSQSKRTDKCIAEVSEIKQSITETQVVKDQDTFLVLEEICKQYIDAVMNDRYLDAYGIFTSQMKKANNYSEYKAAMKKMVSEDFNSEKENVFYNNENNLYKAYLVKTEKDSQVEVYVCELRTLQEDKNFVIGIQLDKYTKTYKVCYIEM